MRTVPNLLFLTLALGIFGCEFPQSPGPQGNGSGYTGAFPPLASGIVLTPGDKDGAGDDAGITIGIQPDGKVVLAGTHRREDGTMDFTLIRHLPNGHRDPNFGDKGQVFLDSGGGFDVITDIGFFGDKILVAGITDLRGSQDVILGRLLSNGAKDVAFGTNGHILVETPNASESGVRIAVRPSGKFLVAASSTLANGRIAIGLAQILADGSDLDATFGDSGLRVLSHPTRQFGVSDIKLDASGNLFAAGFYHEQGTSYYHTLVGKFDSGGNLDPTFGADNSGIYYTPNDLASNWARALGIQSDGKVVVAINSNTDDGFILGRLTETGVLDGSFSESGFTRTEFDGASTARDLTVGSDDRITVVGTVVGPDATEDFALAQYNPSDGSLESGFGKNGKLRTAIGYGDDLPFAMAFDPSRGRLMVGGVALNRLQSNFDFALAAYQELTGAFDSAFSGK